jgi:hypothetical protein
MAATVAIMLYMQLPRVAFEAQRDREQLLIDRGEQYTRAVQLYVHKFNRFPADMDALENTQNIRFLRRRYIDPMTGKNEWRLVHVGPGGVFTDSLVHAPKKKDDANAPQNFITELPPVGGNQTGAAEGVNLANRRRPSDQGGDPNNQGQQNGSNGQASPAAPNGPVMVLPDGRIVPATTTGYPPSTPGQTGAQPGAQGQPLQPGQRFQPGQPFQPGQTFQPGQGGLPNGFQNQPNQPNSAAANMINQILTTPRPGGLNGMGGTGAPQVNTDPFGNPSSPQNVPGGSAMPGAPTGTTTAPVGTPVGQGMGGTTIGGGIAGVASKLEQEGIKIYNDRTAYNEWEFVYDSTKDTLRGGGMMQQPGTQPGTQPAQSGAQNGFQNGALPGAQTGTMPTGPAGATPFSPGK